MTIDAQVDAAEQVDSRRRRRAALAAWTAALLVPAGVGYALWTASGTGDGSAKALNALPLTVGAGTAAADLYPGATGAVRFSVTNPNPYAVTITSGTGSAITAVSGSCAATDFTLGTGSVASTTIAAGATGTVVLTGALTMKASAPDACQGVTVTVTATLSGTQA
jgi:hypothetical protein